MIGLDAMMDQHVYMHPGSAMQVMIASEYTSLDFPQEEYLEILWLTEKLLNNKCYLMNVITRILIWFIYPI